MCMGSGSAPPPAPLAPPPIQGQDKAMTESRDNERRRQASKGGSASTILTGPSGDNSRPAGSGKTLLGA